MHLASSANMSKMELPAGTPRTVRVQECFLGAHQTELATFSTSYFLSTHIAFFLTDIPATIAKYSLKLLCHGVSPIVLLQRFKGLLYKPSRVCQSSILSLPCSLPIGKVSPIWPDYTASLLCQSS